MQAAGGGQNHSCEGNPVLVVLTASHLRLVKHCAGFFRVKHVQTNLGGLLVGGQEASSVSLCDRSFRVPVESLRLALSSHGGRIEQTVELVARHQTDCSTKFFIRSRL